MIVNTKDTFASPSRLTNTPDEYETNPMWIKVNPIVKTTKWEK